MKLSQSVFMRKTHQPVMKTAERLAKLDAARPGGHAAQARAVPVDLAALQYQAGRLFAGRQLHGAGHLMLLLGDEEHLVLAKVLRE